MLHFFSEGGDVGMQVLGYLRKEPALETAQNSAWFEAQRLAIRRFCRKRRLGLLYFFEDRGEDSFDGSALDQMLSALEQKEADCAVVCGEYEGALSYNIEHLERTVEIRFFSRTLQSPLFAEEVI